MEDLYDPEEKIMCPYNESHYIRRCKMSFHLVKCKKNYGEQKKVPCDFNATHMIAEPELRYHHQMCPDRKKLEPQIVESQSRSENRFPIPNLSYQTEESWDDENCASYDPKKYTENSDVLRHLDVESGTKRRNFRLNERQRLSNLHKEKNPIQEESRSLPLHRPPQVMQEDDIADPEKFQRQLVSNSNKLYLQFKSDISNNK